PGPADSGAITVTKPVSSGCWAKPAVKSKQAACGFSRETIRPTYVRLQDGYAGSCAGREALRSQRRRARALPVCRLGGQAGPFERAAEGPDQLQPAKLRLC